jgi:hypothetical protein
LALPYFLVFPGPPPPVGEGNGLTFVFPLAAALKAVPAQNLGTFLAAIFISLPVRGFLPFRAFLFMTENVPKPMRVTLSPFYIECSMELVTAFKAFPAATFEILASFAIFATISAFVI